MAFSKIDLDGLRQPTRGTRGTQYPFMRGLISQLPPEDGEALTEILKDPLVSYAKAWRIIRDQESEYPDIHPSWFQPSQETVRKYCVEVRGL